MIEVWILILFCFTPVHCEYHQILAARVFETEQQCQQIGGELIKRDGRITFGHTALCIKGVR